MKINKNTTNAYACHEKYIILCILYKNCMFLYSMKLYSMELHLRADYKSFHFHQYFCHIPQLIYQLFYFYTYIFYFTFTFTITRIPNKLFITYSSVN